MIESQARKSLIRQHDQSDCGVACLATIIRYYNGYVPLESLRQMSGTTKDGTTLLDNVTEDVIINLLNGIRKKMIVFFVTHRTSVARTANRIYTLRDGRAFECTRLESNDS